MTELRIEGYTISELEALIGSKEFDLLIFTNKPTVINAGSSQILAQFHKDSEALHIDLVHIEGGGEGVLISITSMAKKYAKYKGLNAVNWYVYATNCADPNPKLQKILRLRKFEIKDIDGKGEIFYKQDQIESSN